jgi:hypothetical protein
MQRKVLRRTNGKVRRPPFNFLYYCKKKWGLWITGIKGNQMRGPVLLVLIFLSSRNFLTFLITFLFFILIANKIRKMKKVRQ